MEQETLSEYDRARVRVEKKRSFRSGCFAYVVVNAFLITIWATTGAGYFWPAWILGGWGIGLVFAAWDLYYRSDVTADDIEREMRRTRRPS